MKMPLPGWILQKSWRELAAFAQWAGAWHDEVKSEDDVTQLKEIFAEAAERMQAEIGTEKDNKEDDSDEQPSHSSEIEEESDVSELDEEQ